MIQVQMVFDKVAEVLEPTCCGMLSSIDNYTTISDIMEVLDFVLLPWIQFEATSCK